MAISVFDLFKIGIGPSSSHTVGPMLAARSFARRLEEAGLLERVVRVRVELFGSLGVTGRGHGTDTAVLLGLCGEEPRTVPTDTVPARLAAMRAARSLPLLGKQAVAFNEAEDLLFNRRDSLPFHSNGMRCEAFDAAGARLASRHYFSIGGGFVVEEGAQGLLAGNATVSAPEPPHPFHSADELVARCTALNKPISRLMLENELAARSEAELRQGLLEIWNVMQDCVRRGCERQGVLPGGMQVRRRAADLHRQLSSRPEAALRDPLTILDWVDLYALAVNEENAAGGRVVTAPTNGAAGVIPAVLHYYARFVPGADDDGIVRFLLTAGAIGSLIKQNASISGAEVGCQGEIGSACSMAAGALAEVLGGSPKQVENAAEIGMEHNLGLTCDPIGGLVQVPCIERNAMAAIKAINAARMALRGDGHHFVSLDKVIQTMLETGRDMSSKYKETARGGLALRAVSQPDC